MPYSDSGLVQRLEQYRWVPFRSGHRPADPARLWMHGSKPTGHDIPQNQESSLIKNKKQINVPSPREGVPIGPAPLGR
ncbi:hypothetical protein HZ326_25419 [Fusarium oxysporum f. sp. albedinis]|nr:hypothetical protein HZ326_25419 [Fusarium oxysporum f. sp. albedinis]